MNPNVNWTWSDFRKRYERKRLGFIDIDPLTKRIALPFLSGSWIGLLLIDSESDLFTSTPAKSIAIIVIAFFTALFGALSAHSKWPRDSLASIAWMVLWPPLFGVIYALLGAGYILWVNALLGDHSKITITGPVVEKIVGGGRYTGKDYFLTINSNNRIIRLAVTTDDYAAYPVGALYSRQMIHGGLGIYYSWGVGIWK